MKAILREPVLRSRGDTDYQRLTFIEDLSGAPGEITYTSFGDFKTDFLRYGYLRADGSFTVGTLSFTQESPQPEDPDKHAGVEPSDGSIVDWVANGGDLELTWDAGADFDRINITAYQAGARFFRGEVQEWTNPYTESMPPPDPTLPVSVEIHLHKGSRCICCKMEYLPSGTYEAVKQFMNYNVVSGVTQTFTFADLINTDGADDGEFVLMVPPEHGHAVFPSPVLQPEGHPILIPARQGVVTVGADVTPQYTLSHYARICHRQHGNWQDWPSGPPTGYTVDAVLGSTVAVRQSAGGGVLELSA